MCNCGNCLNCLSPGDSLVLQSGTRLPVVSVAGIYPPMDRCMRPGEGSPRRTNEPRHVSEYAKEIRAARLNRGLTYRSLAVAAGMNTPSRVSMVERGRSNGNEEFHQAIGRVLGIKYTGRWKNSIPI